MPSRDYRNKAKACLEATEVMRDPMERLAMLQVAQGYLNLANHAAARPEHTTPRDQTDQHPKTETSSEV